MSENIISLKNISVSFDGEVILDKLNLDIKDGAFVTLLGPSGCGKTTTLRIIGGFQEPDSGDVFFGSERINDLPPHKRKLNTVFQRYALFPHLNVYENIAFGMRIQKKSEAEIKAKVCEMLKLVSLEGFEKRRISTLSGGQQQRVAIARAMIAKPAVILADEPTGNLDSSSGEEILSLLRSSIKQYDQTLILITHDMEIAKGADRIITISDGKITG